jgi:phosphoribosylformimino-5-aminoimidazole carboxamide ribotide isomerase
VRRDGTAAGGDDGALAALRAALPSTRLIVTGGVATLADIRALAAGGMNGVVLGRALYDGSLDLAEALRVAREPAPAGK